MIYTEPRIVKGKKPIHIPKGSNLEKEYAKNIWYVNYQYNGKQYRIKENINRIKDHKEKARQAEVLLTSIKNDLSKGYDPENPTAYFQHLAKDNITLSKAVDEYLEDVSKYLRKKSVQSYESKLRYLVEAHGDKKVKDITTKQIEKYIYNKIHKGEPAHITIEGTVIDLNRIVKWTPYTVKAAKGYFRAFFNWCKSEQYLTENPVDKIDDRKIRSEATAPDRHIPFTEEDLRTIMRYLDKHDLYTAFFSRIIYSTCLRPSEIVSIRLEHINLSDRTITIPLSGMKNTKKAEADFISIEPNLYKLFVKLKLSSFPGYYYLTSSNYEKIVGEACAGHNRPYKRFTQALRKLNMNGKGYNLYSFKHFSNIQRYNNGWTLVEIMKANRHSSIAMTEKYLKNITRTTDISDKQVPSI